jgi:hypothetical protein
MVWYGNITITERGTVKEKYEMKYKAGPEILHTMVSGNIARQVMVPVS